MKAGHSALPDLLPTFAAGFTVHRNSFFHLARCASYGNLEQVGQILWKELSLCYLSFQAASH